MIWSHEFEIAQAKKTGSQNFTPLSTTVSDGKPLFTTALEMPKTGYS
jgi:hypothetical protein